MRRSTRIALAAVLACGLVGLLVGGQMLVAERRFVATHDATDLLTSFHQSMLDSETGLRGYQLTRDPEALGPYRSGSAALDRLNRPLARAVSGDPQLTELWTSALRASDAWRTGWAQPIVANGGERPAGRPIGTGRELFDVYRAAHGELQAQLDTRAAAAAAAQRTALIVDLVASLLVGVVAFVVTRRRGAALSRAVVEPVRELLDTVRRVGEGDLAARTSGEGPEELRRIGAGLADAAVAIDLERQRSRASEQQATRRAADLETLLTLSRALTDATTVDEVVLATARAGQERFAAAGVRLWVADDRGLQVVASVGVPGGGRSELAERALLQAAVIREERPDGAALAVRMTAGGTAVGVLECLGTPSERVSSQCLGVLEAMAMSTGAALRSARLHAETLELSRRDGLTGLLNRRTLDVDLVREARHARRHGAALSVVLLDVDHFKPLNDQHGHGFGDEVLATLGRTLANALRDGDEAYRYGGEEFVILLRDTSADDALVAAERIRGLVRRTFDGVLPDRSITASFGIADTRNGHEAASLLAAADDALYAAKKRGRDRCEISDRRPQGAPRALQAVAG